MKKFIATLMGLCLTHASTTACAMMSDSIPPKQNTFFVGLGGGYHSVKFKQDFSASGVGIVYDENGVEIATGYAGGPGAPFAETACTFATIGQLGFIRHCNNNNRFWGMKYQYQFLDITSIDKLIDTPQSGFLTPLNGSQLAFTGNVITKSAQTKINHEMDLLIFIGQTLEKCNLYLGIGPSVFGTQYNIYQSFGFANLNGLPRDATGTPADFESTRWVLGGAVQLGLSRMLNRCWLVDMTYTYALSESYSNHDAAPFSAILVGGYADTGTLFVDTKKQIRAQGLNLTLNRVF